MPSVLGYTDQSWGGNVMGGWDTDTNGQNSFTKAGGLRTNWAEICCVMDCDML